MRDLTGAPAGSLAQAASTAAAIQARREIKAALGKASAAIDDASRGFLPSADSFSQALSILASAEPSLDAARDLVDDFRALRERAEDGRRRALAAEPLAADAESKSAGADWRGAAEALAAAEHALGSLAGEELAKRVEQLRGWADAVERSLGPAEEALRRLDALYAPAAEGDLAEVDWDAAEQALREARRSLRPSAKLPSPLPQAWLEAGARAEALAKRGRVLAAAQEKISAGRAVEAIPVLQAEAAGGDTVVLAVLSRLLIETADDASAAARGWLAEAARALGQGELATAEAYLALANSYTGAAPQVVPEAKRIERQIASLGQIRNATLEARGTSAAGEMEAALACYRQALELGTDAEAGLPGEARRKLVQLLDLEGEFAPLGQPGESPGERARRRGAAAGTARRPRVAGTGLGVHRASSPPVVETGRPGGCARRGRGADCPGARPCGRGGRGGARRALPPGPGGARAVRGSDPARRRTLARPGREATGTRAAAGGTRRVRGGAGRTGRACAAPA